MKFFKLGYPLKPISSVSAEHLQNNHKEIAVELTCTYIATDIFT